MKSLWASRTVNCGQAKRRVVSCQFRGILGKLWRKGLWAAGTAVGLSDLPRLGVNGQSNFPHGDPRSQMMAYVSYSLNPIPRY